MLHTALCLHVALCLLGVGFLYTIWFHVFALPDRWVRRHGKEQRLPGLGRYSQRQMFWVSAANVWCAKYRDKALKLRVMTGVRGLVNSSSHFGSKEPNRATILLQQSHRFVLVKNPCTNAGRVRENVTYHYN